MPLPSSEYAIAFAAALWIALAVDRWLGEPPAALHPVVWMGRYLGMGSRIAPRMHQAKAVDLPMFFCGALVWCVGAMCVWGIAMGLQ
ncbi:MAG TPA: cobalamin biosynthesis protein, partial [Burkholderiaceae bacterium]